MSQKTHLGRKEATKLVKGTDICDCAECNLLGVCYIEHNGHKLVLDKKLNPVGKLVDCEKCIKWMKENGL